MKADTTRRAALALGLAGTAAAMAGPGQAQALKKDPVVVRMYTGPDGLAYAEEIPIPDNLMDAVAVRFTRVVPGPNPRGTGIVAEWHTAPHRRYHVTISGAAEIELSGGQIITADVDHILLAEDFTGKGHRSRRWPVGGQPWLYVQMEMEKPNSRRQPPPAPPQG